MSINSLHTGRSPFNSNDVSQDGVTPAARAQAVRTQNGVAEQKIAAELQQSLLTSNRKTIDNLPVPSVRSEAVAETKALLDSLPGHLSTDVTAMLALLQDITQKLRTSGREGRVAAINAQLSTGLSAAANRRDAAMKNMAAGLAGSSAQVVGGAISVRGATRAGNQLRAGAQQLGNQDIQETARQGLLDSIQHRAAIHQGASGGITGLGEIGRSIGGYYGALDEATADGRDAQSRTHGNEADIEREIMQQMLDAINGLRSTLASIEDSRAQTSRELARN